MSDASEHIQRLLAPILASLGLRLWDLEFKKEGPKWLLRVYIDREEGGVTIEDCESVSRDLGTVLDVEEVINHAYTLEVSSPGLDRSLKHEDHYQRSVGKMLKIKLYQPIDGEKLIIGTLRDVGNGQVTIETEQGRRVSLALADIASARLVVIM